MFQSKDNPQELLAHAEIIYDAETVSEAIQTLADVLNGDFSNHTPLLLTVMTGGCYLLGQLLPKLTFPLEVGYVHATRYHGKTVGKSLIWKVKPKNVKKRQVIIVDDILDAGITLKYIVDECLRLGAADVKTVVLADKSISTQKPVHADYYALTVPDKYVFGCGMDVFGWWRNLPGIYALKSDA